MKFDNLSNLNEIYDCFVENNQHFNFENLDRAMDEYEKYILSIDGLKADVAQELHSRALLLGCVFEQQGFLHGLTKGINLFSDAEMITWRGADHEA